MSDFPVNPLRARKQPCQSNSPGLRCHVPDFLMFLLCLALSPTAFAKYSGCPDDGPSTTPGFYKDLLIDRGIALVTQFNCLIADEMGLSVDNLEAVQDSIIDQTYEQNLLLVGSPYDTNGILLYPDGQPRFRMVWVMGGQAYSHGVSLGQVGRSRFKTFFDNGGSYSGSCAGAFIADANSQAFFALWSGRQNGTGHSFNDPPLDHDVRVPIDSPLVGLPGFNFSPLEVLSTVRHVGGGYLTSWPAGTEILLTYKNMYQTIIHQVEGKPVCWAYKPGAASGRLVNIGSHPEPGQNAVAIEISKAMITYALAGQGEPEVKTTLTNGGPWCLNRATEDGDPAHTRIGDRQYHHFKVELFQASTLQIDLDEEAGWNSEDFDLHLYLRKDDLAFGNAGDLIAWDTGDGITKTLNTTELPAGEYYIGVTCPNTVAFNSNDVAAPYDGSTAVLNGVAYSIRATWGGQQPGPYIQNLAASYCNTASSVPLMGWPTGGVFQGPGVSGNQFSPASLAAGTYYVTYTLGCVTATHGVQIKAPPMPPRGPQIMDVQVRPSGPGSCLIGIPLMVEELGGGVTYQWEVENEMTGHFQCPGNNSSTFFVLNPNVPFAKVRVSAVNDCGQGPPTPWFYLYQP